MYVQNGKDESKKHSSPNLLRTPEKRVVHWRPVHSGDDAAIGDGVGWSDSSDSSDSDGGEGDVAGGRGGGVFPAFAHLSMRSDGRGVVGTGCPPGKRLAMACSSGVSGVGTWLKGPGDEVGDEPTGSDALIRASSAIICAMPANPMRALPPENGESASGSGVGGAGLGDGVTKTSRRRNGNTAPRVGDAVGGVGGTGERERLWLRCSVRLTVVAAANIVVPTKRSIEVTLHCAPQPMLDGKVDTQIIHETYHILCIERGPQTMFRVRTYVIYLRRYEIPLEADLDHEDPVRQS